MRWALVFTALTLLGLGAGDVPPGRCSVVSAGPVAIDEPSASVAGALARARAVGLAVESWMSEGTGESEARP